MSWFLRPPNTIFTFGMFLIFLGGVYTYSGKAYIRFNGWVSRAEDPKGYWWEVGMCYLCGFGLIGCSCISTDFQTSESVKFKTAHNPR
jgi:hypothetical protein